MAVLIAFYSRAGENYFGGAYRNIAVGNTEKAAEMLDYDLAGKTIHPFCTHEGSGLSGTVQDIKKAAPGAVVTNGLAIHGSSVDSANPALEKWVSEMKI